MSRHDGSAFPLDVGLRVERGREGRVQGRERRERRILTPEGGRREEIKEPQALQQARLIMMLRLVMWSHGSPRPSTKEVLSRCLPFSSG
eukprot:2519375-Rhodomonas_salina.2